MSESEPGPPMTHVNAKEMSKSLMYNDSVCLLKPCLSSIINVLYIPNGRDITVSKTLKKSQ